MLAMTMSTAMDFHSQIASIMEILANSAVAEICKVVDDGYAVVHLEMSRSQKENEFLRRKIKLLELQIARYRAERVRGTESSISSRFPGVRLHTRQDRATLAGMENHTPLTFPNMFIGALVFWLHRDYKQMYNYVISSSTLKDRLTQITNTFSHLQ